MSVIDAGRWRAMSEYAVLGAETNRMRSGVICPRVRAVTVGCNARRRLHKGSSLGFDAVLFHVSSRGKSAIKTPGRGDIVASIPMRPRPTARVRWPAVVLPSRMQLRAAFLVNGRRRTSIGIDPNS